MADASIFAQYLKPVKSVAEYQDEGDQRTLSRLKLLLGQQEAQQKQQGFADDAKFRGLTMQYGNDQAGLLNALRSGGLYGKAKDIESGMAAIAAQKATTDKTIADTKKLNAGMFKDDVTQAASAIFANPDIEAAKAAVIRIAQKHEQDPTPDLNELAQITDATQLQRWAAGKAMSVEKLLPKNDITNVGDAQSFGTTDFMGGRKETGRETIKESESQRLTRERQAADAEAGRKVTMRGQNLVNDRARELNETTKSLGNQEKQLRIQELQGKIDEKARGKDAAVSSIENQIGVIDKALTHPGRETATGLSGVADPRNYVWGTNAADFKTVLDQIGGAAFLQAFESLKGGGAITEVEGKKATDAMARLNRAQSDDEFKSSLDELRGVMTTGYKRLSGKDYGGKPPAAPKPGGPKPIKNDADYNALPSGAEFIGPDGKTRRKP